MPTNCMLIAIYDCRWQTFGRRVSRNIFINVNVRKFLVFFSKFARTMSASVFQS